MGEFLLVTLLDRSSDEIEMWEFASNFSSRFSQKCKKFETRRLRLGKTRRVWPDLAKFRHFGKMLKDFGNL